MVKVLRIVLLLLLLLTVFGRCSAKSEEEKEFLKKCPPSRCGSLEIRYPFRLRSSPPSCGYRGFELTCAAGEETLLVLPSSPNPYVVTAIDYTSQLLVTGSIPDILCRAGNLITRLLSSSPYTLVSIPVSLLSCLSHPDSDRVVGPIRCNGNSSMYMAASDDMVSTLPRECTVVSTGEELPLVSDVSYSDSLGYTMKMYEERKEFRLNWFMKGTEGDAIRTCSDCEVYGKSCGFSWARNQTFCITPRHGRRAIIIGTSICGLIILLSASLCALYAYRLLEKKKELSMKVEMFLATYNSRKPTRYTYSDIKKMTKQFRHKLGEGGFGSVFKGALPTGIPVAVKILENSNGNGEDFMNEVATMGRIHHVNVVRLLGFCSEGTKYALIYEFMTNESLGKFIFSKEAKRLSMEKMQEIAIGIARGIEYLHQGCDQRILHFDIKPHNILLDDNLNPKVSDFGLAKLCSRDISIVTMTAARGTLGYVAPEIYVRNIGTISYKSDVYSFGMLLLEIVSGRKNVDPTIETQSQIFFPEWAYNKLVRAEDLGLASANDAKEADIVKKLVMVGLWCIQMHPTDRPSMTRVIQMIMGETEIIQLPPKPFLSSS